MVKDFSTTANNTLLEFPESFPIKVFGMDNAQFTQAVEAVIERHVEPEDCLSWKKNTSQQGKYLAITVTVMARSQQQLDAIYHDLTASKLVKMAL